MGSQCAPATQRGGKGCGFSAAAAPAIERPAAAMQARVRSLVICQVPSRSQRQPAQLANQLVPGPQEQVIGVRQDHVGVQFHLEIALHHTLHRGVRAHGHEHGSFNNAVRGVDSSGTGAGVGALGF